MKKETLFLLLFQTLICWQSAAQHLNVLVGNSNNPEEPSIMLNPADPKYMVAGANIRSAYYSSDTGRTWTSLQLSSPNGVWGDPAIIVDTAGAFYFFHLSNPPGPAFVDRIICQKSTDAGQSWSEGTFFGLNGSKAQDKQWAAVDRKTNTIYATWTEFDKYESENPSDSSHILFVKSTDGGITWTAPLRLDEKGGDCRDDDSTVEGAVPAIGPNGEVYVAWASGPGLVFDKSLDGGATWMAHDKFITSIPGGWSYDIPGIYRANGLPVTHCDTSNGPHRGTIYINWSDQRNGLADTDVWLVKSTDGGTTWSEPIRVNNDSAGKQQFFTWMTIDQANGYLYFVFYDRRAYPGNETDVYMARSVDGGTTFQNFKISQSPFVPTATVFFGDYNNLAVHNGIVRPIWTRMDSGKLSVWTALIDTAQIPRVVPSVTDAMLPLEAVESYPNPFTNNSFVSFKLRKPATVTLSVYDITGRLVQEPIKNKRYPAGKFVERIDAARYSILPGAYIYTITVDNKLYSRKVIKIE
jgi:hypothetical protein